MPSVLSQDANVEVHTVKSKKKLWGTVIKAPAPGEFECYVDRGVSLKLTLGRRTARSLRLNILERYRDAYDKEGKESEPRQVSGCFQIPEVNGEHVADIPMYAQGSHDGRKSMNSGAHAAEPHGSEAIAWCNATIKIESVGGMPISRPK